MPKRWRFREQAAPPVALESWAAELNVSPRMARLLWGRGYADPESMDHFLDPGLRRMARPEQFPGLLHAAKTIAKALNEGRRVAIWGDYDVDGVTSAALLTDFFRQRGHDPLCRLPVREEEGYGLNIAGVEQLAEQGAGVLVTVDCGVTDADAVARARELGLVTVVTDHHLPPEDLEQLPKADAMVNPRVGECGCAELQDLAGVGVAFYLAAALNPLLPGQPVDVRQFLDLAALGSLADVVPLTPLNRILCKNGMLLLNKASRPGIAALKTVAGYAAAAELGAGQITFGLAPRINAAGRMDKAESAYRLLLAEDMETARSLATELDGMNQERRSAEERILQEALEQAKSQEHRAGLVLSQPDWHAGVIGIVASRVVEAYYKPTLLLCGAAAEEGANATLKGSGRSIKEFDLHAGLAACSHVLAGFGGHKQAAGLRMDAAKLEELRNAFDQSVIAQVGPHPLTPELVLDGELPFREIDYVLLKELELMQPFGPGNPEPVFASPWVSVRNFKVFGKNHVSMDLVDEDGGAVLRGKAWRQAETLRPEHAADGLRVAFTPKLDHYNGLASIDLRVRDWNRNKDAKPGDATP